MGNELSRRTLLRGIGLTAVAVPAASWLAACSTAETPGGDQAQARDLLEVGREQGYLRVAIANEPPYTKVETDGTVTGAEPDIFRAVCKRLGIDEIQGVVTPYESMIPGLKANRWDAITAGLFMKQSRCAEVMYSEPVIVSTESFAVAKGNPKDITTIQDVVDDTSLKVAVLPGAFEEGILKTANVPANQMVTVSDGRGGIEAVKSGRADAFLLPTLSLRSLNETDPDFDVTDPIEDAPRTGSGAAFRPSDEAFVEEYNKELAAFKETPEFADILEKWGFDASVVEGVTAEELCKTEG